MKIKYKIAVVGLWHLGEIFSVGLAELGHQVFGLSEDEKLIDNLRKNIPPMPEPQLASFLDKNQKEGRLVYSTDWALIKKCNVLWVTLDTPVNEKDEVDLKLIFQALEKAKKYLRKNMLIVISSQLPVGTSNLILEFLGRPFDYVYTPENLRLGQAINCFFQPERIIVGASNSSALKKIKEIFSALKAEIISMSPPSAEFGKHALNAFLATSISFANDLADLAEKVGADMRDVSLVLKSDPRIGKRAYLDAGLSFSGGTLARDVNVLSSLAKKFKINPSLVTAVQQKNESRKKLVVEKLKERLGTLESKKIAIFGLTYKPGTKTLRRSHALEVAGELIKKGSALYLHDPIAEEKEINLSVNFSRDPYQAAQSASAIVLMTPWPDFQKLNFKLLAKRVVAGTIFMDTANFLANREEEIKQAGFTYLGVGRGQWLLKK